MLIANDTDDLLDAKSWVQRCVWPRWKFSDTA
jgi:hypothetical protein